MAVFFSAATAAGAFGGLLARGIVEMDGVGGKPGWAWIFILEGLATLAVGKSGSPLAQISHEMTAEC
jgi:MFS family permease